VSAAQRRTMPVIAFAVMTIVALSACDSGAPTSTPAATGSDRAAVAATTTPPPAPDCGDAVTSFAPDGTRPPPGQMPAGTFMQKIQARGRLIAGVSADTLLFGFRNPFSGRLEGFDIDMVRRIAQEIFGDPNRIEYRALTYAQRIPALIDGSVDIVADVMTVNCTRWAQISFSSQYFDAGQKVLVRADSKAAGIQDLNGKRMCVAKGSTNFDNMKTYPKVIPVPVDDISDCMVLFQQAKADAVTGDDTVLAGFVRQDPYAKVVGPAITSEPYGLGIAKSHPEFVRFVNSVLEDIRADGTWQRWYVTWLKPTGAVPAPPPAKYGRPS
jgi:polar amino acid transport system substrate-binding protein